MLSKNKLKQIRKLHRKKGRAETGTTIVEGIKIVNELLHYTPEMVEELYITEEVTDVEILKHAPVVIKDKDMKEMSLMETPPGVLAVVQCAYHVPEEIPKAGFVLALDGIRDPGNLGTIIRSALWFDVQHIICSPDCVEAFSPKVVQSSMGGVFRIPIGIKDLSDMQVYGIPVYGAVMDGVSVFETEFQNPGIVVIGNESNGISTAVEKVLNERVTIPGSGKIESLNAAAATAIILSCIYRQ